MSVFTKDKVFIAADRRSYLEHDKGGNSGDGDIGLFLNDTEVWNVNANAMTVNVPLTANSLVASSRVEADGLSLAVTSVAAASTIPADGVSFLTSSADAPTWVLENPSSGGIIKILLFDSSGSTAHIDFTSGTKVNGLSTDSYLNVSGSGAIGLISLSSIDWRILFPSTFTAAVALATTVAS